jgi:DNA-binding response OmpR family regulator
MAHAPPIYQPDTNYMPRILLVGSAPPLLNALANIFTVRGSEVCVSTDATDARKALTEFSPQLVVWDAESGEQSLDPGELGFHGPILILAQHFKAKRDAIPGRRLLRKPFSTDDLLAAVLENAWE